MFPRPVVYADLDGYAIKPHPDTRRKVLTMQIYLPEDETQRDLGTTIYKISPMGVFAWKSYGLVKDKTLPFLPNTGYAFVVIHPAYSLLKSSWHGREAISVPVERPRLSILNTYYREPAEATGDVMAQRLAIAKAQYLGGHKSAAARQGLSRLRDRVGKRDERHIHELRQRGPTSRGGVCAGA